MSDEGLSARLEREAAAVECPICRHRQWLSATVGRCDQCGSEIELFERREEAREAMHRLGDGRDAYVVGTQSGLFAVVANRKFGAR